MAITFSALEIVAADMAPSLAFYRRLGFELLAEADSEPHVEHMLPGGTKIMWDTAEMVASFTPDFEPPSGPPRISLAFDCGSPTGVDEAYASLTDADRDGGTKPWDAFWGQRYAVVHDPDGNPVDLYAALPGD